MIKAIIFDYDGVIVDSFKTIHEIYMEICSSLNLFCPSSLEEFKKVYGKTAKHAYKNLGISPDHTNTANSIFEKLVLEKKPALYKGIPELLEILKSKYILILITSNLEKEAKNKLEQYKIDKYFKKIIGKPLGELFYKKSEVILKTLSELEIEVNESIYIGDRDVDLLMANEIKMKNPIIVEYGWGYSDKRPHKFVVKKPMDIISAISEIEELQKTKTTLQ